MRLIKKDLKKSIGLYKEIISDTRIGEFPPAQAIGFYEGLARAYLRRTSRTTRSN